jgi:hypothetical protein
MLDFSAILIIALTLLTAIVWTHSWLEDSRQDRTERPEEANLGMEEQFFAVD